MSDIKGKISQVIGPVVDVSFEKGTALPKIFDALFVNKADGTKVVLEVQAHVGENSVRAISMDSTDGFTRGMEVLSTGVGGDTRWIAKFGSLAGALAAGTLGLLKGYVFGGWENYAYRDNDEYSPDAWQSKTDLPLPGRACYPASGNAGIAYLFGGKKFAKYIAIARTKQVIFILKSLNMNVFKMLIILFLLNFFI